MTDFSLTHEIALVRELMAVIERFDGDRNITAKPSTIRDTLLVVAGLLHKEAAQHESQHGGNPKHLEDSFAEKARECLSDALGISGSHVVGVLQ
jgi:hypothetical protein